MIPLTFWLNPVDPEIRDTDEVIVAMEGGMSLKVILILQLISEELWKQIHKQVTPCHKYTHKQ